MKKKWDRGTLGNRCADKFTVQDVRRLYNGTVVWPVKYRLQAAPLLPLGQIGPIYPPADCIRTETFSLLWLPGNCACAHLRQLEVVALIRIFSSGSEFILHYFILNSATPNRGKKYHVSSLKFLFRSEAPYEPHGKMAGCLFIKLIGNTYKCFLCF